MLPNTPKRLNNRSKIDVLAHLVPRRLPDDHLARILIDFGIILVPFWCPKWYENVILLRTAGDTLPLLLPCFSFVYPLLITYFSCVPLLLIYCFSHASPLLLICFSIASPLRHHGLSLAPPMILLFAWVVQGFAKGFPRDSLRVSLGFPWGLQRDSPGIPQ